MSKITIEIDGRQSDDFITKVLGVLSAVIGDTPLPPTPPATDPPEDPDNPPALFVEVEGQSWEVGNFDEVTARTGVEWEESDVDTWPDYADQAADRWRVLVAKQLRRMGRRTG